MSAFLGAPGLLIALARFNRETDKYRRGDVQ
jgi:hypothetical protein